MRATTQAGSSGRQGPLWGARAQDWADNEERQLPTYEEAIRRVGVSPGRRRPRRRVRLRSIPARRRRPGGAGLRPRRVRVTAQARAPPGPRCRPPRGRHAVPSLRGRRLRPRDRVQLVLLRRRHDRGAARGRPGRKARRARRDPGLGPAGSLRAHGDEARADTVHGRAGSPGRRRRRRSGRRASWNRSPPRPGLAPEHAFDLTLRDSTTPTSRSSGARMLAPGHGRRGGADGRRGRRARGGRRVAGAATARRAVATGSRTNGITSSRAPEQTAGRRGRLRLSTAARVVVRPQADSMLRVTTSNVRSSSSVGLNSTISVPVEQDRGVAGRRVVGVAGLVGLLAVGELEGQLAGDHVAPVRAWQRSSGSPAKSGVRSASAV